MTNSKQQSDGCLVRGPDPDLVIPEAHLADDEFVYRVVETLETSASIEVERLTKTGGKRDILINDATDD